MFCNSCSQDPKSQIDFKKDIIYTLIIYTTKILTVASKLKAQPILSGWMNSTLRRGCK